MTKNWHDLTALELGQHIGEGAIDPIELAQYFLGRIKEHDPQKRIYVRLTEERALKEAEAAKVRAKNDTRLSPLDGVLPVLQRRVDRAFLKVGCRPEMQNA